MRRTLIATEPSRKPNPRFHAVLLHESARPVLDHIRNVRHRHPGLDMCPRVLSYQAMHFSTAPDALVGHLRVLGRHALVVSLLFGGRPPGIASAQYRCQ